MSPAATTEHSTRRLTLLYILALSAIALLTILGQWSVQRSLARQHRSSTIINMAGRQRMLSQKITKTALLLGQASAGERPALALELSAAVDEWKQAHAALRRGEAVADPPATNSPAVQALFTDIAPHFEAMLGGAALVTGSDQQAGIDRLLAHEAAFLSTMDAIVNQYDREAQADVSRLRTWERLLLLTTLVVLLLEGTLIFRPAVGQIRAAMRELTQAKQAAEESNAEKSRFLARMSHDLRTPLNAILGLVDVSLAQQPASQQARLQTIRDAGEALLRLVDALLDSARLEGPGAPRPRLAPVALADFVPRIVQLFEPQAAAKQLRLHCQMQVALTPWVLTDARMLQQIVMNLLNNAIKFTPTGRVVLAVSSVAQTNDDHLVTIAVTDTGVGIAKADQQRIFESFTQLEQTHPLEGLGLGLNIVARLTEALGGSVSVQSEPGHGSTFTVHLPMQATVAPPIATEEKVSARPLTVLIIEDTLTNQQVFRELLELLGHTCVVAETAVAGLVAAREQMFDAVLLDLQLPEADGCAVAKELRGLPAYEQLPIVAVSAHALAEHRLAAERAGCSAFLSKPLRLTDLQQHLGRAPRSLAPKADLSSWSQRPELLRSLIELFRQEWPQHLQELHDAVSNGDGQRAHFAAHRLKGLVANFHHSDSLELVSEVTRLTCGGECETEVSRLIASLTAQLRELDSELAGSRA